MISSGSVEASSSESFEESLWSEDVSESRCSSSSSSLSLSRCRRVTPPTSSVRDLDCGPGPGVNNPSVLLP